MKLTYQQLGTYSLETSVEHLNSGDDRRLISAVVLGHHAITTFLKATAQAMGETIQRGSSFSSVLGYLNKNGAFEKGETKALELLNKVRNDIEHDEPDFVREEFEVALVDCMHIVERVCGQYLDVDLQSQLNETTWGTLIELGKFGVERRQRLYDLLSEDLGAYGRDTLEVVHERIHCWSCGEEGLLWKGGDEETVKCKFCGETETLKCCLICHSVIYPASETVWNGSVHEACFDRWGE